MSNIARRLVSKKKKRFQDKELSVDLDLTYITPNIVAMGFPSTGHEGFYRNKMSDVKKFLDTRHPHKYRIYNLCSEKTYEQTEFFQVERFPFDDHQAPPFDIMLPFCRSVQEWMKSDPENVVVVHCKAGKGRTGVMICAFLIYSGMQADDVAAMDFYADARTYNKEGVTIRSQRRYIRYFNTFLKNRCQYPYPNQTLFLEKIVLNNPPKGLPSLKYKVRDRDGNEKISYKKGNIKEKTIIVIPGNRSVPLRGDFKFSFKEQRPLLAGRGKGIFHFWLNTSFIDGGYMRIPKNEVDRAFKDKRFGIDFSIDLHFVGMDSSGNSSSMNIMPSSSSLALKGAANGVSSLSQSPAIFSSSDGVIDINDDDMDSDDSDYSDEVDDDDDSSLSHSSSHDTSDPDQLLEELEEEYRSQSLD